MKASFVLVVLAASAVLAKPWPINRPGVFPNAPSQAHDPFPSDPNRPIKPANARPTGDPPVTYLKCVTPVGPYHINAAGEAQIGYGSKIASVGAGKLVNLYDRSSVSGLVHAGSSIDIGDKVALPTQMVHLPNKLDVSFDSDNHQYVQICDGAAAPLPCTDLSYSGCFSCNVAAHTYTSTDDLDVWENQNVRLDIAQKSEFRDLEVHSRAKLYLATAGSYYFQNVHFREDTTLVLGADGDYKLYVENNADFDERFRLQHGRATTFTVLQTDDTGSGYVKIDNAPANRDHELRLNIIQRGKAINGGYVQIGHHQRIRGYVSALGDVFVLYGVSMVPGDCPA